MPAMETVSVLRPPRTLNAPVVIDVDALDDDEDIVFTGLTRTAPSAGESATLRSDGLAYMGFAQRSVRPTGGRSRTNRSAHAGPSASRSTTSEGVIVLDSDDDNEPSSTTTGQSSRSRARLVSPPPPPVERGRTPAVPPLPRHLSSQSSLPLRRRQPPLPAPPIIRPSEHPLPFENRMASLPRLPDRNAPAPAFAPAPRSHHQPLMGFGGALLAFNRQNTIQESNRREREARSSFNLPSFTDIFRRMTGSDASDAASGVGVGQRRWQWSWFDLPDEEPGHRLSPLGDDVAPFGLMDMHDFNRKKVVEKDDYWRPEYTHPDKAGPGFTFDFSPAEISSSTTSGASSPPVIVLDDCDAGPSTAASSSSSATAVETTLVCARCLDPLVLAAPEAAPKEERKKCRVWALRCGHMLDGKCIQELIVPPPVPVEPPTEEYIGKGKGKARAEPEVSSVDVQPHAGGPDVQLVDVPMTAAAADRKGKRRAVEPPEPESSPKRSALAETSSQGNSIRSRLRSHTRATTDESPPGARAGGSEAHVTEPPSMSLPRSRRGRRAPPGVWTTVSEAHQAEGRPKGKGKGRAKDEPKLAIEAEHEWRCSIAGCKRVHYSVRVEGEWRNDEGRGGIALFV